MSRYITLLHFTDQGAAHIKDSATRAHHFASHAKKAGVTIDGQYWTTGSCDGVLVLSAANEKKILHLLAELAAAGNVRTETMQAFSEKEFKAIVG